MMKEMSRMTSKKLKTFKTQKNRNSSQSSLLWSSRIQTFAVCKRENYFLLSFIDKIEYEDVTTGLAEYFECIRENMVNNCIELRQTTRKSDGEFLEQQKATKNNKVKTNEKIPTSNRKEKT
ncbi:CLUMA_CG014556, isoform A [Clunio marinus]|uniref:CLUMA_CG014556, isoform A n=1 Tax=Clunio marinus TaxID=568069 RepID=A0A1J1IN26_9DIPT|nr:CLUMA_CG014556, isoform A [Clunio marinus]